MLSVTFGYSVATFGAGFCLVRSDCAGCRMTCCPCGSSRTMGAVAWSGVGFECLRKREHEEAL